MTDPTTALREAGLKVTQPRLSVLAALSAHPHATVETVARFTRGQLGTVSTQAVYDVLRALTAAGLARRIEPAGSAAVFEARVGDNHHHLVCRTCGQIRDVDCVIGAPACLTPADDHGFAVDEAEVVFWGVCPDCADAGATTPASTLPSTVPDPVLEERP